MQIGNEIGIGYFGGITPRSTLGRGGGLAVPSDQAIIPDSGWMLMACKLD